MKTEKTDINLTPEQAEAMLPEVAMQLATRYQQDPIEGSMVFQLTEAWQEKYWRKRGMPKSPEPPPNWKGCCRTKCPQT